MHWGSLQVKIDGVSSSGLYMSVLVSFHSNSYQEGFLQPLSTISSHVSPTATGDCRSPLHAGHAVVSRDHVLGCWLQLLQMLTSFRPVALILSLPQGCVLPQLSLPVEPSMSMA